MRALVNGVEGNTLELMKGADVVYNVRITADDGSLIDVTADTSLHFILYDTYDRRNAAILDITCSQVAVLQGTHLATLSDTQTAALTAGATYYAYTKRDSGSTTYSFGNKPSTITMK